MVYGSDGGYRIHTLIWCRPSPRRPRSMSLNLSNLRLEERRCWIDTDISRFSKLQYWYRRVHSRLHGRIYSRGRGSDQGPSTFLFLHFIFSCQYPVMRPSTSLHNRTEWRSSLQVLTVMKGTEQNVRQDLDSSSGTPRDQTEIFIFIFFF